MNGMGQERLGWHWMRDEMRRMGWHGMEYDGMGMEQNVIEDGIGCGEMRQGELAMRWDRDWDGG